MNTLRGKVFGGLLTLCLLAGAAGLHSSKDNGKVITKVPTTRKIIALTVDDGPHYKTTPQMLAVLRSKNVKVTLFILGENAGKYPEILSQAVADGHEIASHAYSHQSLAKMNKAQIQEELSKAERAISAVAPRPTLFRPPGGAYNDLVTAQAQACGYTTVLWSIDPGDWRRPGVEQVVESVMSKAAPGSIVLLHDGQYPLPTPQALAIIIDRLREQGYEILTVGELLKYYEVRL